jgi:hypothetical protein
MGKCSRHTILAKTQEEQSSDADVVAMFHGQVHVHICSLHDERAAVLLSLET